MPAGLAVTGARHQSDRNRHVATPARVATNCQALRDDSGKDLEPTIEAFATSARPPRSPQRWKTPDGTGAAGVRAGRAVGGAGLLVVGGAGLLGVGLGGAGLPGEGVGVGLPGVGVGLPGLGAGDGGGDT